MTPGLWRRRFWRAAKWLGLLLVVAVIAVLIDGWRAFGRGADGARRTRIERSPQWRDGHFVNPQPMRNDVWGMLTGLFHQSADTSPTQPIAAAATASNGPRQRWTPPATGLRVTWMGHSSLLVEIDGHRVLTDPNWSERASPLSWVGPRRWYAPPVRLDELGPIDAVVISHDHYDHLDYRTIVAMKDWKTTFVVPLGVGAHLAYWGVPESRIVELDWWERTKIRDLEIVATPARHASGRFLRQNRTLWASWALLGTRHRAWFSGDTGLFPAMADIGARLGPFDVTLIETGQYHASWPDWHLGPEQAVRAHGLVRGRVLFPVHWGLLVLAYHGWTEPIERVLAAAARERATVVAPKPGQSVEPGASSAVERWWPNVAWETAAQSPVVSTQLSPLAPF